MNIPVDGVVIRASGIQANEAAMTGESDELKKDTMENCKARQVEKDAEYEYLKSDNKNPHDLPSPVVLSGTQIATGEGWFVCIVVGKHSCVGKIMGKLEQQIETTPLQMKLEKIATDIGKLGMYVALLTIHVLFLRFFIERFLNQTMDLFGGEVPNFEGKLDGNFKQYIEEWIKYLIIGVAIVVVAVPEGLPLAVMISLAYSVKRMLIDKNFVKRLSSCEIMGGANNICSDKTGTLTMNKMTVTNIWAGRQLQVKVNDQQYNWRDYFNNDKHINLLQQAICCNTSGNLQEASATEQAMLNMMVRLGVNFEEVRSKHLPTEFCRFHFTSKRKRMSTLTENNGTTETGHDRRIHMKGAAEQVLASCNFYLDQNGEKVPLHDDMKSNLFQIIT
jgi:Ca2+ transporting ATPase